MKSLAIIPARSGSKGVKDKNIKELCGKPLMAWTIEAAVNSGCFDKVMVSTDSQSYGDIAISYGAEVPFLRSSENASDNASTWDTAREVVANYMNQGQEFDYVCVLQPTTPLRGIHDIKNAFTLLQERNAKSVISVCELEHAINICNVLGENQSMEGFFDLNVSGRRQDAEDYYRLNGAIYIQQTDILMSKGTLYGPDSYAYIMDKISSVDIDDETDFVQAEAFLRAYGIE